MIGQFVPDTSRQCDGLIFTGQKSTVFLLIFYEYLVCGLYDLLGLYLPAMLSTSAGASQVSFCMSVI